MPIERLGPINLGSEPFANGVRFDLQEEDASHAYFAFTKNLYPARVNGLLRRNGVKRHNGTGITGAINCRGLARWSDAGGTKYTVAVFSVGSNVDKAYRINDATGVVTEITGGSALVTGGTYSFVLSTLDSGTGVGNGALLFCNGKAPVQVVHPTTLAKSDLAAAPSGSSLLIYEGRLLVSGISTLPGHVRFSDVLAFNSWPTINSVVIPTLSEPITALVTAHAGVDLSGATEWFCAFTYRSAWVYRGSLSILTGIGSLHLLNQFVGCPSKDSIAHTPYGIFFVSHDDAYIMRDQALFPIGTNIKPLFNRLREDLLPYSISSHSSVYAVYHKGFVRMGMPIGGNPYPTQEFWVDLRYYPGRIAWFGPHTVVPTNMMFSDIQTGQLFGGDAVAGFINEYDTGNTDLGVLIPWSLKTMRISDFPGIHRDRIKVFRRLLFSIRSKGDNMAKVRATVDGIRSNIDVLSIEKSAGKLWGHFRWNDGTLWGEGGGVEFKEVFMSLDSTMRGRTLEIELTNSTVYNESIEIDNISILLILIPRLVDGYDARKGITMKDAVGV